MDAWMRASRVTGGSKTSVDSLASTASIRCKLYRTLNVSALAHGDEGGHNLMSRWGLVRVASLHYTRNKLISEPVTASRSQ